MDKTKQSISDRKYRTFGKHGNHQYDIDEQQSRYCDWWSCESCRNVPLLFCLQGWSLTGPFSGTQSGIGEQLTRTLISRGWVVIALDIERQTHLGETLSAELGEPFEFLVCDVTKYQQLADSFSKIFEKRGRIDAFCSNAGLVDHSSIYTFASRGQTRYSHSPRSRTSQNLPCIKAFLPNQTYRVPTSASRDLFMGHSCPSISCDRIPPLVDSS